MVIVQSLAKCTWNAHIRGLGSKIDKLKGDLSGGGIVHYGGELATILGG